MLETLQNSPISWFILALIAVASLIFAIYSHISNRKRKEFSYLTKTNVIIKQRRSNIEKLELRFDGKEIPDLSATSIFIWNSGNETLNAEDIVIERPLRIFSNKNAKILDAQIIYEIEPTNHFSISSCADTAAELSFVFIDPGDGIEVQVLHTGSVQELSLDCKIKGGKELRNYSEASSESALRKFARQELLPTFLLCAIFIGIAAVLSNFLPNDGAATPFVILLFSLVTAIGIPVMILYGKIMSFCRSKSNRHIPRGLLKKGEKKDA